MRLQRVKVNRNVFIDMQWILIDQLLLLVGYPGHHHDLLLLEMQTYSLRGRYGWR